ncbi:MAG: carboxypeptidase-like regulatory domain-containing protein, partial [Bacteroidales bacterium]|nr:carboxypeptidase-like regulatory domain-containing protein [Bacteroidales bacterium]
MKKIKFGLLVLSLIFSVTVIAQPGGFPGGPPPGGRPGGGRPEGGFPRGERFDRNMQNAQEKGQTVKQKKVRSGSTFKVVGTLIDSAKNEPIAFGNVAVLDKEDSSLVRGAATDLYGYFEVTEVPQGEYFLRVSCIGYGTRFIPFKVDNNTALGNINVKEGAAILKAVTVKGQRPLYAQDGVKMIYNVADDPSIQTGTTNDALQNAPGVEVDVEGNVTLRGVSSVEIWINDKPSKLTEENLKTYLETLPANALDRIEAITNPSAKYATDAEAVINIITSAHVKSNQFVSFGVNGSTQPNISPWISYMWAKEKLSINVFASGRYSFRNNESNGWSYTRVDGSEPDTYDTTRHQTDTA